MVEYNAKDRRALERLKVQVESARAEAEYHQRIEREALVYARSFKEFVAEAWKIYRPNTPMKMNWHHEYIIELLQGVEEGEFPGQWLLVNVPPRPVHEDEPLFLDSGKEIKIKDIQLGDKVLTHKGRFREITGKYNKGLRPCLKLTSFSGRNITVAEEHPVLTTRGWIEAKDLKIGDRLGLVIPQEEIKHIENTTRVSAEFTLAGYLIGDGSLTGGNCNITNKTPEYLQEVQEAVKVLGFDYSVRLQKNGVTTISLKNGARAWAREIGIAGLNSFTKRVPEFVYSGTNEQISKFISAYFNCDGMVAKKGKNRKFGVLSFSSVSRELLEGVQFLLHKLGIYSRIRKRIATPTNWAAPKDGSDYIYYMLELSREEDFALFLQRIPISSYKKQKLIDYAAIRKTFDNALMVDELVNIEAVGELPCYCLTVAEDSSFTCKFLAVHNCTKSSLVMVLFCAWCWTHNPYKQFACFSHSQDFARRDSRETRRLIRSPWYLERWGPNVEPTSDGDQVDKFVNVNGGQRICYGISQNFVGVNADCFVGNTEVLTKTGWIPISVLANKLDNPEVLSYNESLDELEWKKIEATNVRLADTVYDIKSNSGLCFTATGNHRLYTNRGIKRVCEIETGSTSLLAVLDDTLEMFLRKSNTNKPRRISEKDSELSRANYNSVSQLYKKNIQKLCSVWEKIQTTSKDYSLLFYEMCGVTPQIATKSLPGLWKTFQTNKPFNPILREDLFECSPRGADQWGEESKTQRQLTQIWNVIQSTSKSYLTNGWKFLCALPGKKTITLPSYRLQSKKQQNRQFSYSMCALPYSTSRFEDVQLRTITKVSGVSLPVFDLQVQGNRNFFVRNVSTGQAILVHNCILCDDLSDPKSLSEAKREAVAEAIRSGVVTRFNDFALGTGISIQQRVHTEDATGVFKELYENNAHLIKIPMRYEGQKYICSSLQLEDPRTELGSLLWPEHIPEKSVKTLERSLGQWGTAAQLQQEPIPTGGGLVKERDFRLWPEDKELPEFEFTVLSLDPAFSERDLGKGDAFNPQRSQSAFTYWGAFRYTDPETGENRDATLLIDSLADWMGFPELRKESARLYKKFNPDTFIVENKAAGISLIQDFARAGIYITPFNPMKMDKLSRFMLVAPYIQEGNIFFIDNIQNRNTIAQLCSFPKAKYNDRVDSSSQALLFLLRMGLNYLPEDEEEEEEENARFAQRNTVDISSRLPWSY